MAATGTFDELPAPLTSTRQTIRCTVTKAPNESRHLAIKVTAQSPSKPEDELDGEAFAPEPEPPVPQGTLLCHFDSTYWKHGETVTFRIYAKTPQQPEWTVVQGGVQERRVVNGFVVCVDRDAATSYDYDDFKARWLALFWGELPGLNSQTWTKADYLAKLEPCQGHLVLSHGTASGLWLKTPDEDVFETDVRASMGGGGTLRNRFAAILACECGQNEGFLKAYLDEDKPLEANRFVFGVKVCPTGSQGASLGRGFLVQQGRRRAALPALEHAYKVAFGDFDLTGFGSTIGWIGDPACRLRYLYDGTTGNTLAWKVAP